MLRHEYKTRRQALIAKLPQNSVTVILAAPIVFKSCDTEYPYRQNSNFYYLTGFNEDHAALVLQDMDSIFFCHGSDKNQEIWTGKKMPVDMACRELEVDKAYEFKNFWQILAGLLTNGTTVYVLQGQQALIKQELTKHKVDILHHVSFGLLDPIISLMRMFKSALEIDLLKKAANISAFAHLELMQTCKPDMYEYELHALLLYHFRKHGANGEAYTSIVASGDNACTLHYHANSAKLNSGDLLLVDAGCDYAMYAADISRTYPVNGKFSNAQKQIYALVLAAQKAGIAVIKPGNTCDMVQAEILKVLIVGLIELELLSGTYAEILQSKSYTKFYMHSSGHFLGMDVHDVGSYKQDNVYIKFAAGMVLTVEPGLYIAPDKDVPIEFKGIGVRIEDDVLVTTSSNEVLTAMVVKEISEIETVMSCGK